MVRVMKEWRETCRFRCGDDDGHEYEVIEYTEFIAYHSRKTGSVQWAPCLNQYSLNDGKPVEYVDDHTFKIATTGVVIRKLV